MNPYECCGQVQSLGDIFEVVEHSLNCVGQPFELGEHHTSLNRAYQDYLFNDSHSTIVVTHKGVEERVRTGIRVIASVVGKVDIAVQNFYLRLVCANGMTQRQVGSTVSVDLGIEKGSLAETLMKLVRIAPPHDLATAIKVAMDTPLDAQGRAVHPALRDAPDLDIKTYWQGTNYLTRKAKELESFYERNKMEEAGFTLLEIILADTEAIEMAARTA